jgi:hypothetical protein
VCVYVGQENNNDDVIVRTKTNRIHFRLIIRRCILSCSTVRLLIDTIIKDIRCHDLEQHVFHLLIIIITSSISNVTLLTCPLLRSFTNDTGSLFFNKTAMDSSESNLDCHWLVIGSHYQVERRQKTSTCILSMLIDII